MKRVHDEDGGEDEEEGGADDVVVDHEQEPDRSEAGDQEADSEMGYAEKKVSPLTILAQVLAAGASILSYISLS